MRKVFKVVLTGGPCAGKTTALAVLTDAFEKEGWKVFRISEAASILLNGGVDFSIMSDEDAFTFQLNLIKVMISLENTFEYLAKSITDRPVLIVCDRGIMDGLSYMKKESDRQRALEKLDQNIVDLCDNRYDLVIHLKTAAEDAEQFYNLGGNTARKETIEEAIERDQLVLKEWLRHPSMVLIDNSTNFDLKLRRIVHAIKTEVGLEDALCFTTTIKHYRVKEYKVAPNVLFFWEEHVILKSSSNTCVRLRKRWNENSSPSLTSMTKRLVNGKELEERRNLSGREYEELLAFVDEDTRPVKRLRQYLHQGSKFLQIDVYQDHLLGLIIAEDRFNLDCSSLQKLVGEYQTIASQTCSIEILSQKKIEQKDVQID